MPGGGAGAAIDPAVEARTAGCADRRHRMRGADAAGNVCRHEPRSIASSAMTRRCAATRGAMRARRLSGYQPSASSTARRSRWPISWPSPRWRRICWMGFKAGLPRVFVQIQNGCDHRCTFCIIPYGRGNSRSVPMGAVVDQVRALVEAWPCRDRADRASISPATATDLPGTPKLGQLTKQILRHVPDLKRLRISSIDSSRGRPRPAGCHRRAMSG